MDWKAMEPRENTLTSDVATRSRTQRCKPALLMAGVVAESALEKREGATAAAGEAVVGWIVDRL